MPRPSTGLLALAIATLPFSFGAAEAAPQNQFSIAAAVDSAYDDNVYNGRGPDFVNRVSPKITYHLIDPRVKLDAGYELGYWTYAFGKAQNSLNHRAVFSLEGRPSRRVTLSVGDELARAEDPGFILRAGVVAPQIGITDNVTDASVGVNLTHRWFGAAAYMFHFATFDCYSAEQVAAGLPALYDGAEHRATLAFHYRVTRADDLLFDGRFQQFTAGPQSTSISRWSLANTYSPTVGWRHQFIPALELSANAGPIAYQALDGARNIATAPKDSGVTWRVGSRLRFYTDSWRASVSYTHDLLGATGAGAALWADYVYAQAGYHYLEKVDVTAGGGYFRNGAAVSQAFSYDGVTTDASIDWRVIDNLRLGAYYSLRWQRTGPGAIPPGATAAQFPAITRNVVGIRLLAVLGADARPPKREARE